MFQVTTQGPELSRQSPSRQQGFHTPLPGFGCVAHVNLLNSVLPLQHLLVPPTLPSPISDKAVSLGTAREHGG